MSREAASSGERRGPLRATGLSGRSRRIRPWIGVVAVEAMLLVGYFGLTPAEPTHEPRYLVYPLVWITVGAWAVWRTKPVPGSRPHRLLAIAVACVYLFVLLYVPGSVGFVGEASGHAGHAHLRIGWYAPGWGPLVAFTSPWLRLYLVPFEVIGYASLAYLVYANALALTRGTLSGALGLVTCVGCTIPVVTPLVGLLGGPAAGLATTTYQWSYDIGTLIFLLTVGLLSLSLSLSHRGGSV